MRPSSAEIARTLVAGHLAASVHTESAAVLARRGAAEDSDPARRVVRHPVRHATDPQGRILLLVEDGSPVAAALTPSPPGSGAPDPDRDQLGVVEVRDAPPVPGAPSHGLVTVSGWVEPLAGSGARRAALAFADVRPDAELLDIGRGRTLYRLDPHRVVRIMAAPADGSPRTEVVDVDDYLAATPDPFAADEAALLADLADHHADLLAELCRFVREDALPGAERTRCLRLDRYGLTLGVDAPGREHRLRAAFRQPMRSRRDLAEAFGLLARCRCHRGDRRAAEWSGR